MKKKDSFSLRRIVASALAFVMTLGCVSLSAFAADSVGFESDTVGKLPEGWKFRGDPATTEKQVFVSDEEAHSGKNSLKILDENPSNGQQSPSVQKSFPGTKDITEYVVSAWCNVVKESASGNFGVGISASGATFAVTPSGASSVSNNNYAMYYTSQGAGNGWQRLAFMLTYNNTPGSLTAILPSRSAPTGYAYIDDLEVIALTETSALSILEDLLRDPTPNTSLIGEILCSQALALSDVQGANARAYTNGLIEALQSGALTRSAVQKAVYAGNEGSSSDNEVERLNVLNPGFEEVGADGTTPNNWTIYTTPTKELYAASTTDEHHSGSRAGIVHDELEAAEQGSCNQGLLQNVKAIPAKAGYDYVLKVWVKGNVSQQASVYLRFLNASGTQVNSPVKLIDVTGEWKQIEFRATAPSNNSVAFVAPLLYSNNGNTGTVYFDDVEVYEVTALGVIRELENELKKGTPNESTVLAKLQSPCLRLTATVTDSYISAYIPALKSALPTSGDITTSQLNATIASVNNSQKGDDASVVAAAMEELKAKFGSPISLEIGDSDEIALPTVSGDVKLSWSAITKDKGGIAYISGDKIKLRSHPDNDTTVQATMNVSYRNTNEAMDVKITVHPYSSLYYDLITAAKALDINSYLNGQSRDHVKNSIKPLPTASNDVAIAWTVVDSATSAASSLINPTSGAVTRPKVGEMSASVLLRGTFTKGTATYVCDYPVVVPSMSLASARKLNVKNAGFEEGLAAWSDIKLSAPIVQSTDVSFTGKASLCINDADKTNDWGRQSAKVFGIHEGYNYQLSAAVFTESPNSNPSITLTFWSNEGVKLRSLSVNYLNGSSTTGVWKYLTITATAPAGAVTATATLTSPAISVGDCYFDAVSIYELSNYSNVDFFPVSAGALYFLTASGKAQRTITFYDENKAPVSTKSATGALYAYAPVNAAYAKLDFSAPVDDIKLVLSGYGVCVSDGDFDRSSLGDGTNTPWTLNNATIGNGVVSVNGGSAASHLIPVQEGKSYVFTATAAGNGTMTVEICNQDGVKMSSSNPSASGSGLLRVAIDEMPTASGSAETRFARIVLSGNASFDNVNAYAVSSSISNASMENGSPNFVTFFPYGWSAFGNTAAYPATEENQYTEGNKGLALQGFGLGNGGIRSSFVSGLAVGKSYEVSLNARAQYGSAALNMEFWDDNFNLISSAAVATISGNNWKNYRGNAVIPSGTAYVTMSVSGDNNLVYFDEAALALSVREINGNIQLFVDDYLISSTSGVTRSVHQATMQKTSLERGRWIYGNAFYDEQDKCYKMWYQGSGMTFYYATSSDGINWQNEQKCSYTKDGKQYEAFDAPTVFKVKNSDGTYVYKMIGFNHYDSVGSQSLSTAKYYLLTSNDGVNWTYAKTILEEALDVITVAYDAVNEEYICMSKKPLNFDNNKRTHRMMVSKDLENWTTPVRMYSIATPQDDADRFLRTDGYGAGLYPLGDSYIGFDWRYRLDELFMWGYTDTTLLFSRDITEDWQRPFADTTLIPVNDTGFCAYTAAHPMNVDTDKDGIADETWLYYGCQEGNHGAPVNYYIAVAKWRLNGFVSMDTDKAEGTMTTRPFLMNGDGILVNAETTGSLKAELLDANGSVIAGYSLSDCDAITSNKDGVSVALSWKGSKDLSALKGKTVSVRFVSTNTKLYSMQLSGVTVAKESRFVDVTVNDYFKVPVDWAVENNVTSGTSVKTFSPNDSCTRAQAMTFLWRAAGCPKPTGNANKFTDISADAYYYDAVLWAVENGITSGASDTTFEPESPCTRAQIVTFLFRYAKASAAQGTANPFSDLSASDYFANAVLWAVGEKITSGTSDTTFEPNSACTRAQIVTFLYRMFVK